MDSVEGDLGIPSFDRPPDSSVASGSLPVHRTPSASSTGPGPSRPRDDPRARHPNELTRRISFPDARLEHDTLSALHRWIVGFVLVDFDIDTGPNLDNNYPHFVLPPTITAQLAFASLPEGDLPPPPPLDTASSTSDGYCYSWRIPYPPEAELAKFDRDTGNKGKHVLRLPETHERDGGLYGHVWFNQERDATLRRNFSQRSLVLLTHHAHLSGLFASVLAILGPLHFRHAKTPGAKGGMVESACLNIAAWPDLVPGTTVELPLLGDVLTVALPLPHQAQFPTPPASSSSTSTSFRSPATSPPRTISATHPLTPLSLLLFSPQHASLPSASTSFSSSNPVPAPTAFGALRPKQRSLPPAFPSIPTATGFTKLLLLWELLVLGEPVLIYSNDPRTGSQVVEHLKNLIRPIPFVTDSRPYFHVHDPAFPILCRPGSTPPKGVLIASTNPLVLKNCRHWPHVLRLDRSHPVVVPPTSPPASSSPFDPVPVHHHHHPGTAPSPSASPLVSNLSISTQALDLGRRKSVSELSTTTTTTTSSSRSSSLVSTSRVNGPPTSTASTRGGGGGAGTVVGGGGEGVLSSSPLSSVGFSTAGAFSEPSRRRAGGGDELTGRNGRLVEGPSRSGPTGGVGGSGRTNGARSRGGGPESVRSSSLGVVAGLSGGTSIATGTNGPGPGSASTSTSTVGKASAEGWGLRSDRKRHVRKDDAVAKELEKRWSRGD
ncbi:hypothetical protein JCM10212_000278, partial [Sporobolomyces blumeae]